MNLSIQTLHDYLFEAINPGPKAIRIADERVQRGGSAPVDVLHAARATILGSDLREIPLLTLKVAKSARGAAVAALVASAREATFPFIARFAFSQRKGSKPKIYILLNGLAAQVVAEKMAASYDAASLRLAAKLDSATVVFAVEKVASPVKVDALDQVRAFMDQMRLTFTESGYTHATASGNADAARDDVPALAA